MRNPEHISGWVNYGKISVTRMIEGAPLTRLSRTTGRHAMPPLPSGPWRRKLPCALLALVMSFKAEAWDQNREAQPAMGELQLHQQYVKGCEFSI